MLILQMSEEVADLLLYGDEDLVINLEFTPPGEKEKEEEDPAFIYADLREVISDGIEGVPIRLVDFDVYVGDGCMPGVVSFNTLTREIVYLTPKSNLAESAANGEPTLEAKTYCGPFDLFWEMPAADGGEPDDHYFRVD